MKRYTTFQSNRKHPLLLRLVLVLLVVVALSLSSWWGIGALIHTLTVGPSQINVLELWKSGSYDEILANGRQELKSKPLDTGALIFSGFAAFQKGVSETSEDKKAPLINDAVIYLRKALLVHDAPLQPQIHYILGKAYFHKGKFYADEAIFQLNQAKAQGYSASDMNEYLGLSNSLVGRYKEAAKYFLEAVKSSPSDVLLWTLGQTYFQIGDMDKAIQALSQSLETTKDNGLEQRCRFLLGTIYQKNKNYDLATDQYKKILEKNPNSADAHYYLGEIQLALGNKEAARAEWRQAFKIDPLHFNANQRLFN